LKIASLKRQADARAADAHADRLEYKAHVDRSLALIRERAGSTAGLAIAFSLGLMTGTKTASRRRSVAEPRHKRSRGARRGIAYQLAHGPLGQNALKLGAALVARSLAKAMEDPPWRAAAGDDGLPADARGDNPSSQLQAAPPDRL
jgi:hypothetical protein